MPNNVMLFPSQGSPETPDNWLVGPFEEYRVVVGGRIIPKLTAQKTEDGINLIVDGRFCICILNDRAKDVAWLVSQALAVGSGYSHLGAQNKDQPFAPEVREISSIEEKHD